MLSILVLVVLIAGISLTLLYGASSSKSRSKSNTPPSSSSSSSKTPKEKEEEEEEAEGFAGLDVRYYTQEEFERFIDFTEDENGEVNSELIDMINALPKGELTPQSFVKLSIFDDDTRGSIREDLEKVKLYLLDKARVELTDLEKRAMGSMLGMAIADAMGHRFEFTPLCYDEVVLKDMGEGIGGSFKLKPGQWTDDTSMGLCLADSLLARGGEWNPHDCMHRFLAWWNGGYDNAFRYNERPRSSCGLGGNISMSFRRYLRLKEPYTGAGDENVSGNGSIMRLCPVPIFYHDDEALALEVSAKQSLVTHQGKEAAECCRLMAHLILRGLHGEPLRSALDNLGATFASPVESVQQLARSEQEGENPDRDWRWKIDGQYKFSPGRAKSNPGYIGSYAMDAMAMALNVLWNTKSFGEAVIRIVNLRGDSDSTGAVLGQIAGAFYGVDSIPRKWIETVAEWDRFTIPLRAYMLVNKHFIPRVKPNDEQ